MSKRTLKQKTPASFYDSSEPVIIPHDPVNQPSHYTQGKVECIDAIEAVVGDMTGGSAFLTGQVIRYMWRWSHKNGLEDLKKAQWYLNRLIGKLDYGTTTTSDR